jgi:hypothetical protein
MLVQRAVDVGVRRGVPEALDIARGEGAPLTTRIPRARHPMPAGEHGLLAKADRASAACSVARSGIHLHLGDSVYEGADHLPRGANLDLGEFAQKRGKELAQLRAGERRAEAVVGATAAEAEVAIWRAAYVEAIGPLEDALVPVRRAIEQDDLFARGDPGAA